MSLVLNMKQVSFSVAFYDNPVCRYGCVILEILISIITRKMYHNITKYLLNTCSTIGHTPKCFVGIKQFLKHNQQLVQTRMFERKIDSVILFPFNNCESS